MASSGYIVVAATSHDDLKFEWVIASQSIGGNSSTVNWTLSLTTDEVGRISSTKPKQWSVVVNGVEYSGTNYIGIENNSTKVLASGQTVITHNTDGTKTFSYSFTQELAITFSGTRVESKSGSGTGELDPIPRGATLSSAPNFTDEDNPTITYSNPAGAEVTSLQACISFTGVNDDIEYRDISPTGTNYTFELTDDERSVLRRNTVTSNTRTVYFYVRSVVDGSEFTSRLAKTLTIANCTPTMSPTVVDSNPMTLDLTGDPSIVVRYFSNVSYAINAETYKGATIVNQSVTVGGLTMKDESGIISNIEHDTFIFSVTDSRGNTVSSTIQLTLVEYIRLTTDISVSNPTGEGDAVLSVSGNYFNGDFGDMSNSLRMAYRHKIGNSEYGSWVTISGVTITSNRYNASVSLSGLDYMSSHTFQIRAIDELCTIYSVEKTVRSTPVFDWGQSDFRFNVPVSGTDISVTTVEATRIDTSIVNANNFFDESGRKMMNGLTIYTTSGIDPDTTLDHLILTHKNTPNGTYMYVKTEFYGSKSTDSNRMQIAFPYSVMSAPYFRRYYNGAWSEWEQITTGDNMTLEYGSTLPTTDLYDGRVFFVVG